MGYSSDIYAIISKIIDEFQIKSSEDDQKYFHRIYLDNNLRTKHNIKLDHMSKLVLNLYGIADNVEFHCINGGLKLIDLYNKSEPAVFHANGFSKKMLPWLKELEMNCKKKIIDSKPFKIPEDMFHIQQNYVFHKFIKSRPWKMI